ncbi:hypothetical protein A3A95_02880 [Candidatus Nomurabacteria bacterium RIFCSPLOWO2_01_FULL_39_18]|uniref:Uncharacterized protein n=1 Tax=Candidatus Nomurabacteria bacterium RIFCSPHIGHO2_01_FULL_40_24b TaxID=1801739 RepID=A0A1F6V7A4_9BACT|nr:MAG: hypothetical protein A2647_03685 [Candidatus Nomurabacteria bacterium RIFCSPHIGHO2_01_FULL_40_24b]OGI89606.1 MAG: hypothetical protein A3A95_02880 [Candidatus Nomurabacteria bacterium RIFCSPLOWO2_01_FULL_39_18]
METEQEIIDLVVARLQNLPSNKDISVGSSGEFTKSELIEHVKKADDVGKKMIAIEMDFLRSMKDGIFYEQHSISNNA